MSQVLQFVERGWPCDVPREYESYTRRQYELSVQHGVLMWGARVIIPPKGRDTLLKELHETTRTTTGEVISRPAVERSQSRVEPDMVVPLRRSPRVVKAPDRLDL